MKMITSVKAPEITVVSLAEVKAHLRLDQSYEDEYLEGLILTATSVVEQYLGRSLLFQTWQALWCRSEEQPQNLTSKIPATVRIDLVYPPLIEILSVNALLPNNGKNPIKRYFLDGNRLIPQVQVANQYEAVEVIYQAGYGNYPKNVPSAIRHAVLLSITDLYENRGTTNLAENTMFQSLLQPYRIMRLP